MSIRSIETAGTRSEQARGIINTPLLATVCAIDTISTEEHTDNLSSLKFCRSETVTSDDQIKIGPFLPIVESAANKGHQQKVSIRNIEASSTQTRKKQSGDAANTPLLATVIGVAFTEDPSDNFSPSKFHGSATKTNTVDTGASTNKSSVEVNTRTEASVQIRAEPLDISETIEPRVDASDVIQPSVAHETSAPVTDKVIHV